MKRWQSDGDDVKYLENNIVNLEHPYRGAGFFGSPENVPKRDAAIEELMAESVDRINAISQLAEATPADIFYGIYNDYLFVGMASVDIRNPANLEPPYGMDAVEFHINLNQDLVAIEQRLIDHMITDEVIDRRGPAA